ncbi:hypothetical protein BX600DRAFT_510997 [Xylariales sp. PMI_506]|nr:hypothetical protein BX600DRAFT_510997 [Xylariales sp. PMI_506]
MGEPKLASSDSRPLLSVVEHERRPTSRFIGDSNPEHLFVEATSPNSSRDRSIQGGVGVWQSRNSHDAAKQLPTSAPLRPGPTQTMHEVLSAYVRSQCLPCVPPASDWFALRSIYFEKLDPLFPVIPREITNGPMLSPPSTLVKQVICLAAAANPEAAPHLRLHPSNVLLNRADFMASLSAAIHVTIDAGMVTDRVLLIRILLLYSMYMQPTCPEEADLPTAIFARAAHQLITLGFHLPINETFTEYDQIRTLFCCTWALDRLNSAFYGRACVIHERDVGWDIDDCISSQSAPFRLFLMVTRLLESVFSLYRPTQKVSDEPLYIDMPILEQLIIDAGATKVPSPLLATIEVFYHAVAILSCRFPQGMNKSALPSRANNSRRSLSADRVTELVRDEFHKQLSFMPTIPYAVSLSLSVMYRKMRHSKIPMFRRRGKRSFTANTLLLRELADIFWCAKTMAAMAEQVLQEMDKAVASMAQESGSGENSARDGSDPQTEIRSDVARATPVGFRMGPLTVDSGDTALFEASPEVDVWGHFDPNFNLGAVDAAIQSNLDFGFSANWFEWQQNWGLAEQEGVKL